MFRRAGSAIAIVLCAVMLTACTPAIRGMVGVRLDSQGHIHGVLESCDEPVRSVSLYVVDSEGRHLETVEEWDVPAAEDTNEIAVSALQLTAFDDRNFELNAWAGDKRLQEVRFTLADIRLLDAGEVLFTDTETYDTIVGSEQVFRDAAC